ncbi:histidinol-phosphate transaminase [bacterium]|nr:histidinol-phosphate transaminase [bacterium]
MKSPIAPSHIQSLKRYIAGRSIEEVRKELGLDRIIKLASNENPLGSSPKAIEQIQKAIKGLAIYPDGGLALRQKIAERFSIDIECVAVGSGSEAVLSAAMRAYLQPGDEVVTAEGTFIGFYVLANALNQAVVTVPLRNYTFDLPQIQKAITEKTKLVYLANPNNPTGTAFTHEELLRFLEELPPRILVILDEAYFEYACDWNAYPDSLSLDHPQILILRTFSKAYGLAGVRIGYGIAQPDIIENIIKVKLPFEPTSLSQAAGIGALEDQNFLTETIEMNRDGKSRLEQCLETLNLPYAKSVANFILIDMKTAEKAAWLSDQLLHRGIIARPMVPFRLPHTVRITIGTPDEMTYLIDALQNIFG